MSIDNRRLAVAINGFCTFLNLYSPQALLPELSREFGATAAQISTIMTASTLAVAPNSRESSGKSACGEYRLRNVQKPLIATARRRTSKAMRHYGRGSSSMHPAAAGSVVASSAVRTAASVASGVPPASMVVQSNAPSA